MDLKDIQKILVDDGLDCSYEEAREGMIHPHILLYIGHDYKERKRILQVYHSRHKVPPAEEGAEPTSLLGLELVYSFPFKVTTPTVVDSARFVTFMNRHLPFPGLEMDEVNGHVLFRYNMVSSGDNIDKEAFLGVIGAIITVLEGYTMPLEEIVTGLRTANEVLEKAFKEVQNK